MGHEEWAGAAYAGQDDRPIAHLRDPEPEAVPAPLEEEEPTDPAPTSAPVSSVDVIAGLMTDKPVAHRPAGAGWRAALRRASFGRVQPRAGAREAQELADRAAVCAQWSGTKTVVVANPKGGSGKTPTTLGIAAAFGDLRGGSVIAWDNNETLGTLGIRSTPGSMATTALDLLARLDRFEHADVQRGDLNQFVRHQAARFDVLASSEDGRRMAQIGDREFRRIHRVLARYYDLLVVDTGNNIQAPNFLAAADIADVLVIPVRWAEDVVLSAGRLIAQLQAIGWGSLAAGAVVVVTGSPSPAVRPEQIRQWRTWFEENTAAVVQIPHDPLVAAGHAIDFYQLTAPARRAYVRTAAVVATQFVRAIPSPTLETIS